jgi:hypothetical protein
VVYLIEVASVGEQDNFGGVAEARVLRLGVGQADDAGCDLNGHCPREVVQSELSWRLTTICIAAPLLFWSTIACAKGAPVSFRTGVAHGGYAKKSAGILSMKPKAGLLYVW